MADTMTASRPGWEDLTESGDGRQLRGRPDWTDVLFFIILSIGTIYALVVYKDAMDIYEKVILVSMVPSVVWLGWLWRPLRTMLVISALTIFLHYSSMTLIYRKRKPLSF